MINPEKNLFLKTLSEHMNVKEDNINEFFDTMGELFLEYLIKHRKVKLKNIGLFEIVPTKPLPSYLKKTGIEKKRKYRIKFKICSQINKGINE